MNEKREEKLIHDMYKNINTPEYDAANDVLNHIRSAPRKSITLKRVIIIAAVICLCAAALGAVKMMVQKMINFDGEITQVEYQPNPITPSPIPEAEASLFIDEEHEFTIAAEQGELRIAINFADNSTFCNIPYVDITSLDTIFLYAQNSYTPLSFPQYIPQGYSFSEGGVSFFVGEDCLNAELIYSETQNDILYEIYNLPEGYEKNISGIHLDYYNNEGHRLQYSIHVTWDYDKQNPFTYNLSDGQTAKIYIPDGFDEGLLIHDSSESAYSLNSAIFYKKIEPINAIWHFAGKMHPETQLEKYQSDEYYYETYSALIFSLNAENLSEEELIKIAESIH